MFDNLLKIGAIAFVLFMFTTKLQAQTGVRNNTPSNVVQEETVTPEPNGTEPHIESIGNDPVGPPETTGPYTLVPSGEPEFIESIGNDPAGPPETTGPATLIPTGEPVIIESIGNDPAIPADRGSQTTPSPGISKPE